MDPIDVPRCQKVSDLPLAAPTGHRTPQAGEVVGRPRQRQLDAHLRQASQPEASHPALLLPHPHHRLHRRLAPLVDCPPYRIAQLPPHAAMRRVARRRAGGPLYPPTGVQLPGQHRIGQINIPALGFQGMQVGKREEAAVGTDPARPLAAAPSPSAPGFRNRSGSAPRAARR
jgi:hypothetical protein